jgi:hypothetical protein
MRRTLGDLKKRGIPAALGLCATDARLLQWLDEAQEILLNEGKWWGTVAKFQMCATDGCITLPPQIAVIEAVNVCGRPVPVRDFWYEFLENGPGSQYGCGCSSSPTQTGSVCGGNCGANAIYRGHFPTFNDIIGTNKKATLICDLISDVGKRVLVLGYDENGNWIRTTQGGVIADGEIVLLAQGAGTLSNHFFTSITDLQFLDDRDGQVWLYEYDTTALTLRMLGKYEYFEDKPNYARYFFPGILAQASGTGCNSYKVEVMGKVAFIPAKVDTDYLVISSLPALKEMMLGIRDSDNEADRTKANAILMTALGVAKSILDAELDQYLGTGRRIGINITGSNVGATQPVENFI